MSLTAGDEGQGGWFGAKEVRTRRLSLGAIFLCFVCSSLFSVLGYPERHYINQIHYHYHYKKKHMKEHEEFLARWQKDERSHQESVLESF